MRKLLLLLSISSLLSSCFTNKNKEIEKTFSEKFTSKEIITQYSSLIPLFDSLEKEDQSQLIQLYTSNQYQPFFHDTLGEKTILGEQIHAVVKNSLYYGLPQHRIYLELSGNQKDSLSKKGIDFISDIQLTMGLLRFFDDLTHGFSDSLTTNYRKKQLSNHQLLDTLISSYDQHLIDSLIDDYRPKYEDYDFMYHALQQHLDTANLSIQLQAVPLSKEDSASSYQSALKNLELLKFPFTQDEKPTDIIKRFQKTVGLYADGIIGDITQIALEESPLDFALRIAWNMEKTRIKKRYPKHYMRINIPEFKLFYFNQDTIVSIHNVVVGKPQNQSPTLEAKIYGIQTLPFWNVPYSIATKEVLPAVKANKNYLDRNEMQILRGNDTIDHHTIKWSKYNEKNFPYKVRQRPGKKNALGIIKFEFYNKYDVYIHDTPQKYFLDRGGRAYSHGCIRCKDPVDLAKSVLEIDKNPIDIDSLDTLLENEQQQLIRLKKNLPIFIEYNSIHVSPVLTKEARKKNERHTYEYQLFYSYDIYKREKEYIDFFFHQKKNKITT